MVGLMKRFTGYVRDVARTRFQSGRAMILRPNDLRFTRAAPIDRDVVRAHLDAKMATILSTRSGVGWKRLLGGVLAMVTTLTQMLIRHIKTEAHTDRIVVGEASLWVRRTQARPSLRLQTLTAIKYVVNPATGYVCSVVEKGRAVRASAHAMRITPSVGGELLVIGVAGIEIHVTHENERYIRGGESDKLFATHLHHRLDTAMIQMGVEDVEATA
jgi:hypothetical protein